MRVHRSAGWEGRLGVGAVWHAGKCGLGSLQEVVRSEPESACWNGKPGGNVLEAVADPPAANLRLVSGCLEARGKGLALLSRSTAAATCTLAWWARAGWRSRKSPATFSAASMNLLAFKMRLIT